MSEIETRIREAARKVLESGEVSVVIGWGAGSVPFKTTPVFIRRADEVDRLVWNPACVNNLSVYLPRMTRDGKVAIVAKPCDIRSMIGLFQENQARREDVYVIGLGCGGVVDAFNLESEDFRLQDIRSLEWDGPGLKVTTETGSYTVERSDCLREMCKVCDKREPAIYDVRFGEAAPPEQCGICVLPDIPEERRKYWSEQFEKCIRCYACRQVCPNCYCETCFADRIEPKWTAKKATADESWMFHATRAMHLAGRCVGCGECERVCPVDIPVAQLASELAAVIKERYGYEAGDPEEERPLLGTYRENDEDPAQHSG